MIPAVYEGVNRHGTVMWRVTRDGRRFRWTVYRTAWDRHIGQIVPTLVLRSGSTFTAIGAARVARRFTVRFSLEK